MRELWKPIQGYEGKYEASTLGQIRSLKSGKILVQCYDGRGYYKHVTLWKNGTSKCRNVHRLVAETWIDNPNGYKEINHIDEDKTNNAVSNLEWCDHIYNNNYGSKLHKTRGTGNPMNKVSEDVVRAIRTEFIDRDPEHGLTALAKKYGLSVSHTCSIIKGERWGWLT